MKRCPKCCNIKVYKDFCKSSSSKDGRSGYCKDCSRNYMRGRKSDPEKRRQNAKRSDKLYPDRRRAREKVKDAVRAGKLLPIKKCFCADCGSVAAAYDHFRGYSFPLDVEPTCYECHGKRSRKRGEHKAAGRLLKGKEYNEFPDKKPF